MILWLKYSPLGYQAPEVPAGSHASVQAQITETENWDDEIEEQVEQFGTCKGGWNLLKNVLS